MSTLTLRGCDEELTRALKLASEREGRSVNKVILETLNTALLGFGRKERRHHDLDRLAGTWTGEDAAAFEKAVAGFETPDGELWS